MSVKNLKALEALIRECFKSPEDCGYASKTIEEWFKSKYTKIRPYVQIQREPIDLDKVLKMTTQPYALFTI